MTDLILEKVSVPDLQINNKEIKSDDFQFQLFWYCLYIDSVNIELKFLHLNI